MNITERTWTVNDARIFPSEVCIPCGRLFQVGEAVIEAEVVDDFRVVHAECFTSRLQRTLPRVKELPGCLEEKESVRK